MREKRSSAIDIETSPNDVLTYWHNYSMHQLIHQTVIIIYYVGSMFNEHIRYTSCTFSIPT